MDGGGISRRTWSQATPFAKTFGKGTDIRDGMGFLALFDFTDLKPVPTVEAALDRNAAASFWVFPFVLEERVGLVSDFRVR